jgi:hypothetical protein
MTLWQKIKLGFGAAVGLLIGVLGFTIDRRTKQRDQERTERLKAEQARAAESERRGKERKISQAMNEQREANENHAQKPIDRTGKFGTSDRLR